MTTHIVCYSGGEGSALTGVEVVRKFGAENVVLVNHDMHFSVEDADVKRFKREVAEHLCLPITFVNYKDASMDQFDVCVEAQAFKVDSGPELCTNRLKTAPFMGWLESTFPLKDVVIYYGFDSSPRELLRIQRRVGILGAQGYATAYPLAFWPRTIHSTNEIGIAPPLTYAQFKHANCFSGDTKFLTRDGSVTLKESVGKSVEVITRNGWSGATVEHFGQQQIVELELTNGGRTRTLRTTANHRWITPKHNHKSFGYTEKTTNELKVGDIIPTIYSLPDDVPSRIGIQHGFTFGDGAVYRTSSFGDGKFKSRAYVAEGKEEIIPYFENHMTERRNIHGLPCEWKTLPSLSMPAEYLLGFVIGLVASDGCVSKSGIQISNKDSGLLEGISQILSKLGIASWVSNMQTRDTNYKQNATLGSVVIPRKSFKREWLIRSFHQTRYGYKFTEPKSWKVLAITATNVYEDVYCAVVSGELKEFVLEGNILTGNCIGCLKAGWQHWYIVYCTRPDIWLKGKWAEEEIGYAIHHDESGPVYLEDMEARFAIMKCAGVPATEHIPHQKFWAAARKVVKIASEPSLLPCECTT